MIKITQRTSENGKDGAGGRFFPLMSHGSIQIHNQTKDCITKISDIGKDPTTLICSRLQSMDGVPHVQCHWTCHRWKTHSKATRSTATENGNRRNGCEIFAENHLHVLYSYVIQNVTLWKPKNPCRAKLDAAVLMLFVHVLGSC